MNLRRKNHKVYVDVTILGRHDTDSPKRTFVSYLVDGVVNLRNVKEIDNAEQTDVAEAKAILFAISELKGKLKQYMIFCDHHSVVSEANNDTPSKKPLIREIQKELATQKIRLKKFPINPAHTLLDNYIQKELKK